MKKSSVFLWCKRGIAALLCAAITLSVPLCSVPATSAAPLSQLTEVSSSALSKDGSAPASAGTDDMDSSTPPDSAEGVVVLPEDPSVPDATATPSPTPEEETVASPAPEEEVTATPSPTPEATATPTPTPDASPDSQANSTPAASAPETTASTAGDSAPVEETVWAGETLTFVDLLWKTAPLSGVDVLFTGSQGQEPVRLSMTAADRGQYTVTVPTGGYDQVAFYAAGTDTDTLGGTWQLSDGEDGGNTVDFEALTLSAFYYDSGENPSYWGSDPNYDPEAMGISLLSANTLAENDTDTGPQPGQQVYFVNMHALDGSESDPIVTVEARFIKMPHGGKNSPGWTNGDQYLARTMYEVRDGIYVTSFPEGINSQTPESQENYDGYLYQEISFDLTRSSGQEAEFNRHYNFRGYHNDSETIPDTWGRPSWFTYQEGTMDAYFYNTSIADSYWNAHPSNADASIQAQLLYIDTRDFPDGTVGKQYITDLYLSWDGMPTNLENYDPSYGVRLGGSAQAGDNNPYATGTEEVYYFKMPSSSEPLTENTVFTLTYTLDGPNLYGTRTFLFTYVPRSGRNTIYVDSLWEDVGEVWGVYQAEPAGDPDKRNVYFNNAVTAFGKVEVVFGKSDGNGNVIFMDGSASQTAEWAQGKLADQGVNSTTYKGWNNGWLNMKQVEGTVDGHKVPDNVWVFEDVPVEYDYVMFRGAVDPNELDTNSADYTGGPTPFWFSPYLKIDQTYQYPCFFAYAYLGSKANGAADSEDIKLGNTLYLDGEWGSALEIYSLGDNAVQIPEGNFESQDNTYYGFATLYDYYSQWELSGHSVTEGVGNNAEYGHQGVLFNLAISKYFENKDVDTEKKTNPLYFGADNMRDGVDNTDRWGWNAYLTDPGSALKKYGTLYKQNKLYNNTDNANVWKQYDGSRTGLVDANLDANELTINGYTAPYFDESFLRGNNDLGITLGNVYNNIRFPFTLNEEGYWEYDSKESNHTLKQDPDGTYYMEKTDAFHAGTLGASYMPFHQTGNGFGTQDHTASTNNLNYMFGQRLDLTFTVPEDGQVNMPSADGTEQMKDVIFEFQGDDDCWVFIDGQLVLDMGGIHDAVRGTINFSTKQWNTYRDLDGKENNTGKEIEDDSGSFNLVGDENTVHTLTIFYMERGLYASNLKIVFNFPQQNTLRVTKEVDTSSVDEIFDEAIANLGGFEMKMTTMATSGNPLPVEDSAGYIQTESKTLYAPNESGTASYEAPNSGEATLSTDSEDNKFLEITQPTGWNEESPPGNKEDWKKYLLTLTPPDGGIDLTDADGKTDTQDPLAFLELELYNDTADNRGAQLYIQLEDDKENLVTGTARTLSYLGEANLFLPNTRSLVRIDLDSLIASNSDFNSKKVAAVRIGLLYGTGQGGNYRLYRASFGTEWNQVISSGFSVGDNQISDYGSLVTDGVGKLTAVFKPVDGAWYTRQTRDEGGNVIESISNMVQNGIFSLSDGQTAVFTDKFRVGSYIRLEEVVDSNLFETTWSIQEDGEPVSFNSLLNDRPDVQTVTNPDWEFTKGETPLENQPGTVPDDGRLESEPGVMSSVEKNGGFVYRGYLYPDNNENLPIDLEVIFTNRMLTGEFTITKKLSTTMAVDGRYPVGTYTFDVYYTNVAGRGLEQYLPEQSNVEGVGTRYIHQVIEITTDENGTGSYTMEGIPAGTQYLIRERPANGATLVNLEAEKDANSDVVRGVIDSTDQDNPKDYTKAYIQSKVTVTDKTTDSSEPIQTPNYIFTNENKPFFMKIQKVWEDDPPADLQEIRIMVQRREAGSEDDWENVTKNFFGEETSVSLKPNETDENNDWIFTSNKEVAIYPTQGTDGADRTILYEYRIVEVDVGKGELASYQVVYDQVLGDPAENGDPVVIYRATNSKTGLTLKKTWLDNANRDKTRPDAVRVQLQRSTDYDPKEPTATDVTWETIDKDGKPVSAGQENGDDAFITLSSPYWSYTLEGLPVSDDDGNPYYYRMQEVQIQVNGNWVSLAGQNTYEPAYSQPVTLEETAEITVENALRTAAIQVTKLDALDNTLLPGAKFQLERLMQAADGSWIVDTSWKPMTDTTSGDEGEEKGTLTFQNLRPGRYRLTETEAPNGYVASYTPTDVTLQAGDLGRTVKVPVTNSTAQTFTFTKVAAEDNGITLSGAEFHLYPLVCGDTSHTHDELLDTDNPGSCWADKGLTDESNQDGVVTFDNLPAGLYRLVETKAPGGYALPTGQWNVTLAANGGVTITAVGGEASVPAFVSETTNGKTSYKLPNRRPMDMPSSGGPGVPIAAALGTLMMGGGICLAAARLRPRRKKRKTNPKQ